MPQADLSYSAHLKFDVPAVLAKIEEVMLHVTRHQGPAKGAPKLSTSRIMITCCCGCACSKNRTAAMRL